jgi:SAM-dependent methyltransferase
MHDDVTRVDPAEYTRRLAADAARGDDTFGWFERLYRAAEDGAAIVPWDRRAPHRLLVEWAERRGPTGDGRRALVVGCGFGDDAEYVAGLGYATVAFDIASTAVEGARRRFPESSVEYLVADLLAPPPQWRRAFDLVVESLTVQSLPRRVRTEAIASVRETVAPGGTLLVVASALAAQASADDGPPWPLTRAEIDSFAADGLQPVRVEEIRDELQPTVRRWRAEFRRDR